jgi:hypothetical protein
MLLQAIPSIEKPEKFLIENTFFSVVFVLTKSALLSIFSVVFFFYYCICLTAKEIRPPF